MCHQSEAETVPPPPPRSARSDPESFSTSNEPPPILPPSPAPFPSESYTPPLPPPFRTKPTTPYPMEPVTSSRKRSEFAIQAAAKNCLAGGRAVYLDEHLVGTAWRSVVVDDDFVAWLEASPCKMAFLGGRHEDISTVLRLYVSTVGGQSDLPTWMEEELATHPTPPPHAPTPESEPSERVSAYARFCTDADELPLCEVEADEPSESSDSRGRANGALLLPALAKTKKAHRRKAPSQKAPSPILANPRFGDGPLPSRSTTEHQSKFGWRAVR